MKVDEITKFYGVKDPVFERWLNDVDRHTKITKRKITDILEDKDKLREIYSFSKGGASSASFYHNISGYIKVLASYYDIEPDLPSRVSILETHFNRSMYASLYDIFNFINKVSFYRYGDGRQYLHVKTLVVLGWNGISLKEASVLKESSVVKDGDEYYVGGYKITHGEYVLINSFMRSNGNRDSGYLFTSAKEGVEHMSHDSLASIIRNFNNAAKGMSKVILYRNLRKNALFVEVYDWDASVDNIDTAAVRKKIQDIFGCDSGLSYLYLDEYISWKNIVASKL